MKCIQMLIFYAFFLVFTLQICTTPNLLLGCISCSANEILVLKSLGSSFTHDCSTVVGCTVIDVNNVCIQCKAGSILPTDTPTACIRMQGCKVGTTLVCTTCLAGYALNTGVCNIINSPYCWQLSINDCSICPYPYLIQSNCTINTLLCLSFDTTQWACTLCPANKVLHSSGVYCITIDAHCIVYNVDACVACVPGYYVKNNQCVFVASLLYSDISNTAAVVSACINTNYVFNAAAMTCASATNIPHCAVATGVSCTLCVPRYYLSEGMCVSCASDNCLQCTSLVCQKCMPAYYLSTDYTCLQCLNCIYCVGSNSIVSCLQCAMGYILFQGSCIQCPDGLSFDIQTRICLKCSDVNCRYCKYVNTALQQCLWCNQGYNLNGATCVSSTLITIVNANNGLQFLSKALTLNTTLLYNNLPSLIGSCNTVSNGFECKCSKVNLTSICTTIPTFTVTFDNALINIGNFESQRDYQRLLSQIPSYKLLFSFGSTDILSISDFASLLQTAANTLNRAFNLTLATQVGSFARLNMNAGFTDEKATVIQGTGYYMKYRPSPSSKDDKSVVSTNITDPTQYPQLSLIFFNTYPNKLTGQLILFTTTSVAATVNLTTVNTLGNSQTASIYQNNQVIGNQAALADGYVQISVSTNIQYYSVAPVSLAVTPDPYTAYRIENVLLQDSYIYILVFLTLYLVLLPLCALVDFVELKNVRRKDERVSREEGEVEIIKINYKDFFPIYNIANSERTKRLKKVCLFIVNLEHGVTFLTLFYFRLSPNQSIFAVVLGVPAYLCSVGMGYACGAILRKAEGQLAYLVNIFTIAYWIIWVVTMSQFTSTEYKSFIYFFLPLFLVLDLIADSLETFLIYFAVRQEEQQIALFNCLARWFSWRGYYEFNALAKQLEEAREEP